MFKVNDRVILDGQTASDFGPCDANPVWKTHDNLVIGTIKVISTYGDNIRVLWDNGAINSYFKQHLKLFHRIDSKKPNNHQYLIKFSQIFEPHRIIQKTLSKKSKSGVTKYFKKRYGSTIKIESIDLATDAVFK